MLLVSSILFHTRNLAANTSARNSSQNQKQNKLTVRRKKSRVSSDWLTYWGSNKELQADVLANGEAEYTREIVHLCKTRSECSYLETWEIFKRHALLNESYYNAWVTCKIHKAHLGGLHNKSL